MSNRLIGYHEGDGLLYGLSGASKLLFFILVSIACMMTYDTRFILAMGVLSMYLFYQAKIGWKDISFVVTVIAVVAAFNLLMVYLFSPHYGAELYGREDILISAGYFSVSSQELFYLFNLLLKYFCTVPLAILFLMTTHPSQFAASLSQIGISYRIAYSVSLTLRYIPDIQEEFYTIRTSQEARGLELSKKAGLISRIKGNLQIALPLIFSSLERIETVSTAMELRRFGKNKKRTWYKYQVLRKEDWATIILALLILALSFGLIWLNQGRFYNPWA
ncbi:energy-coupling factor transporter transmembrane component T family protein [Streptococcus loxodontisalivarius]|uniref:Energy-coupling factor transport system permease protein n=1 Tax=Streptococcus loxodontisalivarius TaxID=1349415 RepID=A0ABS2PV72_9STRE|nr:energy-coupling factor transporter transmembrane component T [Streptococcus loxodontisalivarius]MBM7643615.1 energy-coupling factor transport system permease protein [Streptococcus loxodontisalivarius]